METIWLLPGTKEPGVEAYPGNRASDVIVYWDVGSGSADTGLQVIGNHIEVNNSIAFQCQTHPETPAGKISANWAAPGIPSPPPLSLPFPGQSRVVPAGTLHS